MMPFPGGIESTSNGALLLSVAASIFYLFAVDAAPSWRRSVVKTLSIALLAVLAFVEGGPTLLVAALAISAAGDALLSRDGDTAFLAGLASFLAAHVAYVVLFLDRGNLFETILADAARTTIAFFMAVATLATLNILLRRVPGGLRLPVAAYSATILLMGLAALTTPSPWIILGAILFMVSDTLLGWERFVMSGLGHGKQVARYAVWVAYYLAQLLITLGFLLR
jgi:uncharacterized membrane protein YhhN